MLGSWSGGHRVSACLAGLGLRVEEVELVLDSMVASTASLRRWALGRSLFWGSGKRLVGWPGRCHLGLLELVSVDGIGEFGADEVLEGLSWHPEHVAQVNDGESGLSVGFPPLPGHGIRFGAADPEQPARFLHGE